MKLLLLLPIYKGSGQTEMGPAQCSPGAATELFLKQPMHVIYWAYVDLLC